MLIKQIMAFEMQKHNMIYVSLNKIGVNLNIENLFYAINTVNRWKVCKYQIEEKYSNIM